jgi:two-component system copper resistance phosphate regulon response regulator CusR
MHLLDWLLRYIIHLTMSGCAGIMAKILIVEDDLETAALMHEWLTKMEHHIVESLNDGDKALVAMRTDRFDVIILDWQLPGLSGQELCRDFRRRGGNTPILMLTAKDTIADKEIGFRNGVDDYLTKPFNLKELSLRIMALMKRPQTFSSTLQARDLILELDSRRVTKSGKEIMLTAREFAVLEFLLRHKRKVFAASEILKGVWESDAIAGTEALRQCIKRLREKIDIPGESSIIENVSRKGYTIGED